MPDGGRPGPDLWLFDDAVARGWEPFALSRPIGELIFGTLLLRERTESVLRSRCRGHLCGPSLEGFTEPGAPPAVAAESVDASRPRVLVSSRTVLDPIDDMERVSELSGPATLVVGGRSVGWILAEGDPLPDLAALAEPAAASAAGASIELPGEVLDSPWEAMSRNADRVASDIERFHHEARESLPPGVQVFGGHRVSVAEDARVEPGVVLDASEGPIRIEQGATIRAFTRLEGPSWIGTDTTVFGGSLSRVSLGPVCKIRGEVEETVVLGYTNKAHDGFLGHAYLGRWVNLGALTTNSDLKNNYGAVRLRLPSGEVDTGAAKVGCFLGDHVKTGIGTMLNTGTVVGLGSNLFGAAMPPAYVPPFSWGSGAELTEYRIDRFLEVARTVMKRREQVLAPSMAELLRRAWEDTRALRG